MKRHKNGVLPALAALMIALGTLIIITRGQDQTDRPSSKAPDVTPIREGVMTETQRRHSKLYENRRNRKLRDLPSPVDLVVSTPWGSSPEENIPRTLDEFLRVSVCSADAVVVGIVKNKSSQLTDEGTFIFTDSEMTVEEILKNNSSANIQPRDDVLLTRPGGAVELNGKILRVTDRSFKPLEVEHKYLVFLRFIPATGAYQQLNSKSAFELSQNRVNKLTEEEFLFPFVSDETNPIALVAQVRAVAINCKNDPERGAK